ncbi:MAG TPA: chemotaxis protein CheC [Bacillales bacterium]|nr:chemotaxis protein CheC [Bacillales bacterium]
MELPSGISWRHLDILKEIGNIGAGHAATALAKLLKKKIELEVPDAGVVTLNEMCEHAGGAETVLTTIFLRIRGDVPGSLFILFAESEAQHLVKCLIGCGKDEALERSVLMETGNILAGSFLSALSDFTGLSLQPTPPTLITDMAGAVLVSGLAEASHFGERAIMMETAFTQWAEMTGQFLYVPDPDAFATLFQALGVDNRDE